MSKYETHVYPKLFLVECWARDGLIDEDIAKKLGISYSSFRDYKKKHLAFSTVLKNGKEVIDYEVENALLKRAKGYDYEELKTYITKDANGKETQKKEKTIKHIPPDTTAQIFWLKNRKKAEWNSYNELKAEFDKLRLEIQMLQTELKYGKNSNENGKCDNSLENAIKKRVNGDENEENDC